MHTNYHPRLTTIVVGALISIAVPMFSAFAQVSIPATAPGVAFNSGTIGLREFIGRR